VALPPGILNCYLGKLADLIVVVKREFTTRERCSGSCSPLLIDPGNA